MILDDFFWRAVIAGMGVAILAGPLGCFVIWRRMSYLGDTMAHSALLGVALGIFLEVDLIFGVFVVAIAVAMILFIFSTTKTACKRCCFRYTFSCITGHGSVGNQPDELGAR